MIFQFVEKLAGVIRVSAIQTDSGSLSPINEAEFEGHSNKNVVQAQFQKFKMGTTLLTLCKSFTNRLSQHTSSTKPFSIPIAVIEAETQTTHPILPKPSLLTSLGTDYATFDEKTAGVVPQNRGNKSSRLE